jgi:hypothetical protein
MATKIICRASDCIFWENKFCTSEEIVYDPEEGCLTYEVLDDMVDLDEEDDEWEDDELVDEEEDADLWEDEEEDFLLDEDEEEDDFDDEKW